VPSLVLGAHLGDIQVYQVVEGYFSYSVNRLSPKRLIVAMAETISKILVEPLYTSASRETLFYFEDLRGLDRMIVYL